ncbi:MAG: transglutaminase family protein [Labilithrix sp.]|nr:transglutaminase family protein [Labilithrix sp.]
MAQGDLPSFEELAKMPDAKLDAVLGAALVARDAYDDLDVRGVLRELASLGAPLEGAALHRKPLRGQAEAVSERFRELGFRGNTADYYDPRNSLLPDVLERKLGIPITLSLVWCELAKHAGVFARGVAFPGHFLVRVDAPAPGAETLVVDPFDGGRILDDAAIGRLLERAIGEAAEVHPTLLAPASARAILVRLLTNLESTWAKRGDHARALVAIDRILTLVPDSARMLRERAALALRIGATELARADLSRVIELEPHAPDVPHIEARLAKLAAASKQTFH